MLYVGFILQPIKRWKFELGITTPMNYQ